MRVLCFFLAMCAAVWFSLNMPATSRVRISQSSAISQPRGKDAGPSVSLDSEVKKGETAPECVRVLHEPTEGEKIFSKLRTFGRLFSIVWIAAFIGAVMEGRRWHMKLAHFMRYLTRIARLPEAVGLAMPAALCSNAAANSILVSSMEEGRINHSALIAGGMINSYLAYLSHSIRVMYPVIGAIGLPGVLYFCVQFSGGLFIIFCVLLWHHSFVAKKNSMSAQEATAVCSEEQEQPLPWKKTLKKAWVRAWSLLFRMGYLTVPLSLGMEWLVKTGALDFWERLLPFYITQFFPSELLSIVATQIGGLVQSATVSANLYSEGLITNTQILLAMLVASAVGNPIRMLRRNLPTALGVFPPSLALIIVLGMQFSRLVTTGMSIVLVLLFM